MKRWSDWSDDAKEWGEVIVFALGLIAIYNLEAYSLFQVFLPGMLVWVFGRHLWEARQR